MARREGAIVHGFGKAEAEVCVNLGKEAGNWEGGLLVEGDGRKIRVETQKKVTTKVRERIFRRTEENTLYAGAISVPWRSCFFSHIFPA
jgi:hypothetical protein